MHNIMCIVHISSHGCHATRILTTAVDYCLHFILNDRVELETIEWLHNEYLQIILLLLSSLVVGID